MEDRKIHKPLSEEVKAELRRELEKMRVAENERALKVLEKMNGGEL